MPHGSGPGSEFAHALTSGRGRTGAPVRAAGLGVRAAGRKDAAAHPAAGQRTILFVDEVHRWNKAQQDAVLPHVESGTVTMIGATTENPSFEVNSALLSRVRVFVLRALSDEDIERIVRRAVADDERGLGGRG